MPFASHMPAVIRRLAKRRVAGFTVVELMLVILVIGILAAVSFPKISDHRERLQRDQAIQDIARLLAMIDNYELDRRSYPSSLADIGSGGLLDPWGRAYVYVDLTAVNGKGKARKDHKLNPINSDFDLYSVGKDGRSKPQLTQKDSLDDIVRARDGAFVGVAADFAQ